MAIYPLNVTTSTTMRETIVDAFTAAGILTTTHYASGGSCIVTLTHCDKVLRWAFNTSYRWVTLYFGDAWVSGDAVTNSVQVTGIPASTAISQAVLVVTADIVALVTRDSVGRVYSHLLARQAAPATDYLILAWSSGLNAGVMPNMYNTTTKEPLHLGSLATPCLTAAGSYYQHEWIVMDSGYQRIVDGVRGCLALAKPPDTGATHVVYGDDVVIPCVQANNHMTYTPNSCLIVDGNSWAPAA